MVNDDWLRVLYQDLDGRRGTGKRKMKEGEVCCDRGREGV